EAIGGREGVKDSADIAPEGIGLGSAAGVPVGGSGEGGVGGAGRPVEEVGGRAGVIFEGAVLNEVAGVAEGRADEGHEGDGMGEIGEDKEGERNKQGMLEERDEHGGLEG